MLWAALTFSAGMPFLYVISALFYGLYYWVYKWLLLNFYRRTTNFNEDLPLLSMTYMRTGILCHLVIGLFIMTNTDIIEGSSRYSGDTLQSIGGQREEGSFLSRLIYSDHAILYFVCFTLYVVSLILFAILGPFASRFRSLFVSCLGEEKFESESENMFKELAMVHLSKFYERSKDELKNFLALMDKG